MDFSRISYERVTEYALQLSDSSEKMREILERITTQFNKVGNDETWSGGAAATSKDSFDTLSARFPEFYQSVKDCSTYLNKVVENFRGVETAIKGQQ